jgi:cytochrome c oxidase cbb3-type subunit 3
MATCAPCHKEDLSGNIGPNLKRQIWLHGGHPTEIVKTITEGVPAKGMLTWGPILGRKKITEVAAFVLSFHKKGEPIGQAPPWVPGAASNAAPAATQ